MTAHVVWIITVTHETVLVIEVNAVMAADFNQIVLTSGMDVIIITGFFDIAGIEEPECVAIYDTAAGVGTVTVRFAVRFDCRTKIVIVDQVSSGVMPPLLFFSSPLF